MLHRLIAPGIICLLSMTCAEPVTAWAAGVTQENGWRDFDKKFDSSDSEQCWAITAGNLIDWWQAQNPDRVPEGTPQGAEVVRTFMQSFSNAGSDPDQGLNWWFTGQYEPGYPGCATRKEGANGAYLKSVLPEGQALKGSLLTALRGSQVTAASATAALIDGAQAGAAFWIGVSYVSPKGRPAMHSLNIWGVRYDMAADGTRSVCGIWIADSDDHRHAITYVPLKEDGGMLIFHSPDHPIYGRIPRITLDTISVLSPTVEH